jgi:hypothetical protein
MRLKVLERALADIRGELDDFDADLLTTGDAVLILEAFTAIEKVGAGGRTLVAGRAADSGQWRTTGHRSPASWLAETTGTGLGEATSMLETSIRVQSLPGTSDALRRGALSAPQVKEVAAGAAGDPSSEKGLLEAATTTSLRELRDEVRRVKARTAGEADARARYEQIRTTRYLRMWTDHDGAGRLDAKLTPDDMARFTGSLKTESNAIFHQARQSGHRESTAAYDVDALVALVTGRSVTATTDGSDGDSRTSGSRRRGPTGAGRATTMMHLRVPLAALRRGRLEDGESCEIPGVGPVPLATARNVFGDAILKIIIIKGVDVTTVCHLGRAVPPTYAVPSRTETGNVLSRVVMWPRDSRSTTTKSPSNTADRPNCPTSPASVDGTII